MPYKTHEEVMRMHLSNPGVAAEYLIAALETGDVEEIRDALSSIMDAYNSKKSDVAGRRLIEDLSQALSGAASPLTAKSNSTLIRRAAAPVRRGVVRKSERTQKRAQNIAA